MDNFKQSIIAVHFRKMLLRGGKVFIQKEDFPDAAKEYAELLDKFSDEDLEGILAEIVDNLKEFPPAVEIFENLEKLEKQRQLESKENTNDSIPNKIRDAMRDFFNKHRDKFHDI